MDNRPGAGGFTDANGVARAAPDGYTLLEMPNSIVGFKPIMNVELDPLKNLTPLAAMASASTALVVPASLPVKSVAEYIAYAKSNADKTFYGYAGIGTTQQQHMELFKNRTGLKTKGVNYKSSADAETDLLAGRLQAMFVTVASTLGQIEGNELRLFGYTDDNYPPGAPKGPTMAAAGVKGMEKAQIWWGVFGPPGMAPDLVRTINRAINESLADPNVVAFGKIGSDSGAHHDDQRRGRVGGRLREYDRREEAVNESGGCVWRSGRRSPARGFRTRMAACSSA
ncbi:MAG: hypothetical protein K0S56_882 [Microvirga sp.]|nr:hypothetical protein [Microvirga sp.]